MTNKKTTRRAFVSSIISLMLCIAMLVGTTFAWFTDAAESGMNEIIAGNLDVELYDAKDNKIDSATKVFFDVEGKEIQYWEPGVVAYANLKVANVGTMDLKYALSVNYKDRNNLNGHVLSEVLKVAFVDGHIEGKTREEVLELATAENNGMSLPGFSMSGKLAAADTTATVGTETVEDEDAFSVIVYWEPNSAEIDNQYNVNNGQKTNDGNPLGIGLGVKVVASQLSGSGENDSFDDYYDEDAVYPENMWLGDVAHDLTYNAVSKQIEIATGADFALVAQIVNSAELPEGFDPLDKIPAEVEEAMMNGFEGLEVVLTDSIDLNNISWTPIGINGASFKGAFNGNGKTIYNLAIQQLPSVMTLSVDSEANKLYSGLFGRVAGATIKNLNVVNAQITNVGNGTGVIAGTAGVNAGKNTTIENVSVTNAVINSNRQTGGIVGSIYGSVLNCTVTNALITATPDALTDDPATFDVEYDNGDKVGGIVGFSQSDNYSGKFEGNKVSDTTLKAYRDVAGIVGAANDNSVSGSSVTDVTIIADQEAGYYGVKTANAGAVVGRDLDGNAEDAGLNDEPKNVTITVKAGFASAEELQAVIDKGADEIILTQDVALDADTTITINEDTTMILDLNGYTITGVSDDADKNDDGKLTSADNEIMFDVRGNLTVKNGAITTEHTSDNFGWNGCTEIFYVGFNGTLNVENATLENLGGSDMAYAIDLVNAKAAKENGGPDGVTLNISNSTIKSTYIPVRVFNNGAGMNHVTIKNSTIFGKSRALWVHIYSDKDNGGNGIKASTLDLDIFGNGNNYVSDNPDRLIEFGFDNAISYDANGNIVRFVVEYADALQYALDNATDGSTIYLAEAIDYGDAVIRVNEDSELTGYYYIMGNYDSNYYGQAAWQYAKRTINDLTITGVEGAVLNSLTASAPREDAVNAKGTRNNMFEINNLTISNITIADGIHFSTSDQNVAISATEGKIVPVMEINGLTIENCKTTTGGSTAKADGRVLLGIGSVDSTSNVKNVVVRNCTITDMYQGIYLVDGVNVLIENNTISNTTHNAIHINECCAGDIVIRNNNISKVADRSIRVYGVQSGAITIVNNAITDSEGDNGQYFKADGMGENVELKWEDNTIDGVEIVLNTTDGVTIGKKTVITN